MPTLTWGKPNDKVYESGLDRGVLYLEDGRAVPWNGLVSVEESSNRSSERVYYDGMPIHNVQTIGGYQAQLRAVMYPEAFGEVNGTTRIRRGMVMHDQPISTFGLSYRTMIGDEARGPKSGYNIHVLYNLTAIPADISYETTSDDPSLTEFEWDITGIPEEIPGHRPTSHITFKSTDIHPWLMEEIEEILYGSQSSKPTLPSMRDLVAFVNEWALVKIVLNGDGTWTAIERKPGFIHQDSDNEDIYKIVDVEAVYIDPTHEKYRIEDTIDPIDLIDIEVNNDGTWYAISANDAAIQVVDGVFTIFDIEPLMSGPDIFRIETKTTYG